MKAFIVGLSFLIGLVTATSVNAKTEYSGSHGVDSYLRYIPSGDVDAMSGKVEIMESSSEYSYELNPVRNTESIDEENKISNGVKMFDKHSRWCI